MTNKIQLSVLVLTKNEERNIARCLEVLSDFDDVIVIDSQSTDRTCDIASEYNVRVFDFAWNGEYPKKRQWCLDTIDIKYDRVFFVDADEVLTPELIEEIRGLDWSCNGYFVKGRYVLNGKALPHGLHNKKLALFDRRFFSFPVIDDLDIEGMGEIEGHYQPVPNTGQAKIGGLKNVLLHDAYGDEKSWQNRHQRYAIWEAEMIKRKAYPKDPVQWREILKNIFRNMPCRNMAAFLDSYIFKFGFLDGREGFRLAQSRFHYYSLVARAKADRAEACK